MENEEINIRLNKINEEIEKFKLSINRKEDDLKNLINIKDDDIKKLNEKIVNQENKLNQKEEEIKRLTDKIDQLNNIIGSLNIEEIKEFMKYLKLKLKSKIEKINKEIEFAQYKAKQIENLNAKTSNLKNKINDSKNFNKIIKVEKKIKIPCKSDVHTFYCVLCNSFCHTYCTECEEKDLTSLQNCAAISKDFCTECKNKCHWTSHRLLNYYEKTKNVEENKIDENMKNVFIKSKEELSENIQLIEQIRKEFNMIGLDIINYFTNINQTKILSFINYKSEMKINENKINELKNLINKI